MNSNKTSTFASYIFEMFSRCFGEKNENLLFFWKCWVSGLQNENNIACPKNDLTTVLWNRDRKSTTKVKSITNNEYVGQQNMNWSENTTNDSKISRTVTLFLRKNVTVLESLLYWEYVNFRISMSIYKFFQKINFKFIHLQNKPQIWNIF